MEGAMLEAHIKGVNNPATVTDYIIRVVHGQYKSQPCLFLKLARLAAIYYLKAKGIVEEVRQLTLGPLGNDKVHLIFRGVRHRKYNNAELVVIELEGDCPLD